MEIREHIKYWIDSADEDLISAETNSISIKKIGNLTYGSSPSSNSRINK